MILTISPYVKIQNFINFQVEGEEVKNNYLLCGRVVVEKHQNKDMIVQVDGYLRQQKIKIEKILKNLVTWHKVKQNLVMTKAPTCLHLELLVKQ